MEKGTIIKWSILAIVIILIVVILYAVFAKKKTISNTGGGGEQHGGIGSTLSDWFGSIKNPFGGKGAKCDPNNPGYNVDGIKTEKCGANFTGCDPNKCDPKKSGWNECGLPDMNCE